MRYSAPTFFADANALPLRVWERCCRARAGAREKGRERRWELAWTLVLPGRWGLGPPRRAVRAVVVRRRGSGTEILSPVSTPRVQRLSSTAAYPSDRGAKSPKNDACPRRPEGYTARS